MTTLNPSASFTDVLEAAQLKRDKRGNYPAKDNRTAMHWASMFSATDSALRAKDQEIARLNAQLAQSYRSNSELASDKADQAERINKLALEKVKVGLEANPSISEVERKRLVG